jgi:CHAD domain-containing protein
VAPHELDRKMAAVDGFATVLGRLSAVIDRQWSRAADAEDPEGLHDLRVALRRTRAVVRAGRHVLPPPLVLDAGDRLRALTAATGPARDLDVLVGAWSDRIAGRGTGLEPLLADIQAARAASRAALVSVLDDPDAIAWRHGWPELLAGATRSDEPGRHAGRRLGRVVARRLERSQRAVLRAGRSLAPETGDDEVHQLRKDARRLRYLLESFAELAPGDEARVVKHLKSFQDVLGRHQDLVVQVGIVERTAAGLAAADLTAQLRRERDAARDEFASRFAAYDTREAREAFDHLVGRVRGRG